MRLLVVMKSWLLLQMIFVLVLPGCWTPDKNMSENLTVSKLHTIGTAVKYGFERDLISIKLGMTLDELLRDLAQEGVIPKSDRVYLAEDGWGVPMNMTIKNESGVLYVSVFKVNSGSQADNYSINISLVESPHRKGEVTIVTPKSYGPLKIPRPLAR